MTTEAKSPKAAFVQSVKMTCKETVGPVQGRRSPCRSF
jgi:hypothetical protein